MSKKDSLTYRPSLRIKHIEIMIEALAHYRSTHVMSNEEDINTKEAYAIMRKEELKGSIGIGASYIGVSDAERKREKPVKISADSLGFDSEELNDSAKLEKMSPRERELVFLEASKEFMSKEEYQEAYNSIITLNPN